MKTFPPFTLPPLYLLQIMLMLIHNLDFLIPKLVQSQFQVMAFTMYGTMFLFNHVPRDSMQIQFQGLVMYACSFFGLFSRSFLIIQEFGISAEQALGWLMSVPRASGTVLEATVPYSRASMVQLLGKVGFLEICRTY